MQLRDYQIAKSAEGLAVLKEYGLVYLSFEMRTGKTLTSLNIAKEGGFRRVLFITTKKAMGSVQSDYNNFQPGFDLYLVNHECAHTVMPEGFDLVIIDEAHRLGAFPKVPERAKAIKKLCAGLPVIFLSGSPTPESFSQLYHQLWISSVSPFREWPTFYKWANAGFVFVFQQRFSHGVVNNYSKANRSKIDEFTKHLFVSYTQEAAGFTQFVQEHVLKVKMKDSTYKVAATLRARRVYVSSKSGKEVVADTEVKLMQKLHQIYSGSVITEDGEATCFDHSKAEFIRDRFQGQKIAIFYKFRAEFMMLQWVFKGMITESPEEFNANTDLVFCSQIQSGREGTNLSSADALVFFNIDYSHVSYIQARARLQTMERQKACEMYWIFSEGGIEEKILERVREKKDYQTHHFVKDFKVEQIKKIA
jgi:hypothetical protein